MFPIWSALGGGMIGKLAHYLEQFRYLVLHFEKADFIVMASRDMIFDVIVQPSQDSDRIAEAALKVLVEVS